ncbi:MAG TPA: hypothetical protein VIM21_05415, partial [Gemmatimonadaceae bacterium]
MPVNSIRRVIAAAAAVAALFSSGASAQSTSAATDTTRFVILFSNRPAGHLKVWREGKEIVSDYEFNDRGRGPHIVERMTANESGYLTNALIRGHSYFKDSVDERFSYANGTASWKNHVEGESSAVRALPFYMSLDGTPAENDPFLQAVFAGGGRPLPLFPTGEATIEKVRDLEIAGPGSAKKTVSLYAISGLGFAPVYLWLDSDRHYFANVSSWS